MRHLIDIINESFDPVDRLKKAIPWTPTPEQLEAATVLASAFYEAGFDDEYSFDQFRDDLDNAREQIANDDGALMSLSTLTEEMGLLLYAYGEDEDWHDLTPLGYKEWAAS